MNITEISQIHLYSCLLEYQTNCQLFIWAFYIKNDFLCEFTPDFRNRYCLNGHYCFGSVSLLVSLPDLITGLLRFRSLVDAFPSY